MIKKKAIIITFHCCPNYGAVLQTYGLYQYLRTLFQDVEVLDYRPKNLMKEYDYVNTYSLCSTVVSFWSLYDYWKKRRKFSDFLKNMKMSGMSYHTNEKLPITEAQYCFVGSDQIWNPDITHGFDKVYFGYIPHKEPFCVISYAASFGKANFTVEETYALKHLMSNVKYVSVREKTAKFVLEKSLGIKADVVLDPTLLAGKNYFDRFVQKGRSEDYIFVYTLNNKPENVIRPIARKISKEKKLEIIEINGNRKWLEHAGHKVIYDAGPEEFLTLLASAKYVVTDSFHGTAFSVLFHRNFVTIPHKTRGGRMVSLLSTIGLDHRLSARVTTDVIDEEVDWYAVDRRLDLARRQSEEFIIKSINNKI